MDAEKRGQVVEAVSAIHAEQPEGEKKKPTVEEVEGVVGFDVSGKERDAAWEAYQAQGAEEVVPEAGESEAKSSGRVTNRHTGPLVLHGVRIESGQSLDVPGFDENHAVVKSWLDAGIIEAG